jgi:hypothetical protein
VRGYALRVVGAGAQAGYAKLECENALADLNTAAGGKLYELTCDDYPNPIISDSCSKMK